MLEKISIVILLSLLIALNLLKGYVMVTSLAIVLVVFLLMKNKKKNEILLYVKELKKFFLPIIFLLLIEFIVTGARGFLTGDVVFLLDTIKYSLLFIIVFIIVINIDEMDILMKGIALVPLTMIGNIFFEYFVLHIERPGVATPNLFAWQLLCVFPFLFLGFRGVNYKAYKNLQLVFAIIWLYAFFLTQSRGCILAAIIMGGLFLGYYWKNGKLSVKNIFLFGLISLIVVGLNYQSLVKRIDSSINYKNNYTVERIYIWESSWRMFKDNIFTGIGLDSKIFREKYDNVYMLPEAKEKHIPHSHNNFLYFFVQTGLFGGFAFIFMMCSQIRYFYIQTKSPRVEIKKLGEAGVWIVGCTIISQMVDANFHFISMQKIYWVVLGVVFSCIQLYKKKLFYK